MAKGASKCLFLFFLSILIVCSPGTLVGFFYDARKSPAISSATETISFLKLNNVLPCQIKAFVADHRVFSTFPKANESFDLYLNETQVENLRKQKPSSTSWLKTSLLTFLPRANITVSSGSNELTGKNELPVLPSTLKSIRSKLGRFGLDSGVKVSLTVSVELTEKKELPTLQSSMKLIRSILGSFGLDKEVKVSVTLSSSFLEILNRKHERDLQRNFDFINKAESFVTVEANIDSELNMGGAQLVESVIKRATLAASVLSSEKVSTISRSLEKINQFKGKVIGLFSEVSPIENTEREEQVFHSSHRKLLNNYERTQRDTIFPTIPVTNPVMAPVTVAPVNTAPTIFTVPSTNPGTEMPTPGTVPTYTPVPYTNPVPVPITNPVTTPSTIPGAQPVTNPVTTYPAPSGVPVTTPVTAPVATNPPAVPGQSWCVAKSGVPDTALQSALDYACGIGGADCSTIQQSGGCYNPNTLQNHASYAFNGYYQKNPVQTSCDFGGTAIITDVNPSTGSCIYPSSSSSSSASPITVSPTPTTVSPAPITVSPTPTTVSPTPTTTASGGAAPGSGAPPSVLNSSNPAGSGTATVFGNGPPSFNNSSTSMSTGLQPFISCIILVTSMVTGKLILDM